jgi:hypothetical protein
LEHVENAAKLVNPKCLEFCIRKNPTGSLKDAMEMVDKEFADNSEWMSEEHRYSHLRLARLYCDILNQT